MKELFEHWVGDSDTMSPVENDEKVKPLKMKALFEQRDSSKGLYLL